MQVEHRTQTRTPHPITPQRDAIILMGTVCFIIFVFVFFCLVSSSRVKSVKVREAVKLPGVFWK